MKTLADSDAHLSRPVALHTVLYGENGWTNHCQVYDGKSNEYTFVPVKPSLGTDIDKVRLRKSRFCDFTHFFRIFQLSETQVTGLWLLQSRLAVFRRVDEAIYC